jgi:hypothetical protein
MGVGNVVVEPHLERERAGWGGCSGNLQWEED